MLGRYRILGELGRGAMGVVYRATDPIIEREVALKTLLPDLPEDVIDEIRIRFLREARSAGRLSHPNIVTIFDVGQEAGTAYIAMELRMWQRGFRTSSSEVMAPIAKQLDDQEIAAVAAFYQQIRGSVASRASQ